MKRATPTQILVWTASCAVLAVSVIVAGSFFPTTFDWQYTVVSALLSPKHNPDGHTYFALGLMVALALLLPIAKSLATANPKVRRGSRLLQLGLVCGILMSIESLVNPTWPSSLDKVHELLALCCFLGTYSGILTVSLILFKNDKSLALPAALISLPLFAIGVCQLSLYLDQRDLGWVDQSWRDLGIPLWQSFAFWQWIALASLWLSIGSLSLITTPRKDPD